eukprot:GHVU01129330.1.p1 GENE.GHVU01129330.1~~GHVU01129330.1.p1  ORF type:complete len:694 (+),score=86.94 GHVU01129330.1:348-2429(+)
MIGLKKIRNMLNIKWVGRFLAVWVLFTLCYWFFRVSPTHVTIRFPREQPFFPSEPGTTQLSKTYHVAVLASGNDMEALNMTFNSLELSVRLQDIAATSLTFSIVTQDDFVEIDVNYPMDVVIERPTLASALDDYVQNRKDDYLIVLNAGMVLHPQWLRRLAFAQAEITLDHAEYVLSLFDSCKTITKRCVAWLCDKEHISSIGVVWTRHHAPHALQKLRQQGSGVGSEDDEARLWRLEESSDTFPPARKVSLYPSALEVVFVSQGGAGRGGVGPTRKAVERSRNFPFMDFPDPLRRGVVGAFLKDSRGDLCDVSQLKVSEMRPWDGITKVGFGAGDEGCPEGVIEEKKWRLRGRGREPEVAPSPCTRTLPRYAGPALDAKEFLGKLEAHPRVLVAVLTHNRKPYVEEQARSMRNWVRWSGGLPPNVRVEVFDDSSREYTAAWLQEAYDVAARVRNLADDPTMPSARPSKSDGDSKRVVAHEGGNTVTKHIMKAFLSEFRSYDYLIILDSDLVLHPTWLVRIELAYQELPGALISLYNSCVHKTLTYNNFLARKEDLGNAGIVWPRALLEKVMGVLAETSDVAFDWQFSTYLKENDTPLFALRPSAVDHIGRKGSHFHFSCYERSVDFPWWELPDQLAKTTSVFMRSGCMLEKPVEECSHRLFFGIYARHLKEYRSRSLRWNPLSWPGERLRQK